MALTGKRLLDASELWSKMCMKRNSIKRKFTLTTKIDKIIYFDDFKIRIDPCMYNIIKFLNYQGIKTLACCCGHNKYPMTIVVKLGKARIKEIFIGKGIPRKRRFYFKDKEGFYYIPEVKDEKNKTGNKDK